MLLKAPFVLAVVVLCPSVLVSVVVLLHRDSLLRCWTVYGHSNNLWENWVVGHNAVSCHLKEDKSIRDGGISP